MGPIGDELSSEDWGFVAEVAVGLGIKYYKLTGGEPLVREDIADIVKCIREAGGIVSIVTNGSLLSMHARRLAEAGVSRVNVSLHSLKPSVYSLITGGGSLENVIRGIEAAIDNGIPIKINYLVLRLNKSEYKDIISYAESIGADMNVIELIPLGMPRKVYEELHTSIDEIEDYLRSRCVRSVVTSFQSRIMYVMPSGIRITVIRGYLNPSMCMHCTRIRATPDGKLKTCLYRSDNMVDIRDAVKRRDREALVKLFHKINELREPFFKIYGGGERVHG